MADIITVKSANLDNRVVLWEVHPDHPAGEIFIAGDGREHDVAQTPRISGALREGRLVQVLAAVAPEPWDGYDDMAVGEVVDQVRALIDDGDDNIWDTVVAYERTHKNRKTLLDALEAD